MGEAPGKLTDGGSLEDFCAALTTIAAGSQRPAPGEPREPFDVSASRELADQGVAMSTLDALADRLSEVEEALARVGEGLDAVFDRLDQLANRLTDGVDAGPEPRPQVARRPFLRPYPGVGPSRPRWPRYP